MTKREELNDTNSCINRAEEDEPTFTLLGRDAAAPVAIRSWADDRIYQGKNVRTDKDIIDALAVAKSMEEYRCQKAAIK